MVTSRLARGRIIIKKRVGGFKKNRINDIRVSIAVVKRGAEASAESWEEGTHQYYE